MKKLFLCLIFIGTTINLLAQNYQLHAVYMYQFSKYIKWPEKESQGDFIIGILGESPATEHMEKMANVKKVGTRDIVLKKFQEISQLSKTHMLFVGKESETEVATILEEIKGNHTLLITEKEGFGLEGSNINFVERKGRLVFELNQNAMDREGLKVSTELAKLAIVL